MNTNEKNITSAELTDNELDTVSGGTGNTSDAEFLFKSGDWVSYNTSDTNTYSAYGTINGNGYMKDYNGVPEPHYSITVEGPIGPIVKYNIPQHCIHHA